MIKHIYDEPFTEEEIKKATEEAYKEGTISVDEYQAIINEKEKTNTFDGKLSKEELNELREKLVSEKKIRKIEHYLTRYKEHLSGYKDLVGDDLVFDNLFLFNLKHFGYLLKDEPEEVMSRAGMQFRRHIIYPLIQKFGPAFLNSKQIFENRNDLLLERDYKTGKPNQDLEALPDLGIRLPKEPVIWTLNHHFKDDALASVLACQRPIYILFGSLPQFYNTFDGILAYLVGSIIINRKVKSSKVASMDKMKYALNLGSDLMVAPEGVWEKSSNEYLLKLWPGIYRIAMETGVNLVPVIHYIYDHTQKIDKKENPIHTVVDEPVNLATSGLSEKAALDYYRDIMAQWYILMQKKYGYAKKYHINIPATKIKDEKELNNLSDKELKRYYHELITTLYNERIDRKEDLTSREILLRGFNNATSAWEAYLTDLMDTVDRYDLSIETTAHFKPKDVVTPYDVYKDIASLPITKENKDTVIYARKLVRDYKLNDFQSRF